MEDNNKTTHGRFLGPVCNALGRERFAPTAEEALLLGAEVESVIKKVEREGKARSEGEEPKDCSLSRWPLSSRPLSKA